MKNLVRKKIKISTKITILVKNQGFRQKKIVKNKNFRQTARIFEIRSFGKNKMF